MSDVFLAAMDPPFNPFGVFVDGLRGTPGYIVRMLPWWGWILVSLLVFVLLMERSPTFRILARRAWKRIINRSPEGP